MSIVDNVLAAQHYLDMAKRTRDIEQRQEWFKAALTVLDKVHPMMAKLSLQISESEFIDGTYYDKPYYNSLRGTRAMLKRESAYFKLLIEKYWPYANCKIPALAPFPTLE